MGVKFGKYQKYSTTVKNNPIYLPTRSSHFKIDKRDRIFTVQTIDKKESETFGTYIIKKI